MTSLLNFIKIYQLVQKLFGGRGWQTDRQTGDLISLTFLFKGSRLKMGTKHKALTLSEKQHVICTVDANKLLTHAEMAKYLEFAPSSSNKIMLRDNIGGRKHFCNSVQEKEELEEWDKRRVRENLVSIVCIGTCVVRVEA
jgi:hypothetical protein